MVATISVIDVISVILGLGTILCIYAIGRRTGWFAAWTLIGLAFVGLSLRRAISGLIAASAGLSAAEHWIQFVNSILFFAGFYMLYKLFKEER